MLASPGILCPNAPTFDVYVLGGYSNPDIIEVFQTVETALFPKPVVRNYKISKKRRGFIVKSTLEWLWLDR